MNIAIIGAGNGGTSILKSLSRLDEINIEIMIDTDLNAPGIILAKELGVNFSNTINDIDSKTIDMIIEATGVEKVTKLLYENYSNECKIIDSQGALLIMSLVERDNETLERLNEQMAIINETSSVVQNQLGEITSSVKTIHNVSENLISTAKNSNDYIKESDNIIKYVNKIAHQTKILGINANIEAARSGEHGRGFSVVSNEIQKLASDSENFASKINDILTKLSNEIKKINKEIDNLNTLSTTQLKASENVSVAVDKLKDETK
ncbi:MAG: hypothetical protein FH753_15375 [Firmicutes bacterium]|nr:hypothetical protein [Bacillota bacterium]